jgi:hypothetical protein
MPNKRKMLQVAINGNSVMTMLLYLATLLATL